MQFTPEQINSFKDLYKNKFETELSNQDSIEELNKIISLVKTIYKPISVDEYLSEKLNEIKKNEQRKI